ncbi:MAG: ferrous iron transport protein B [Pirellulales bacterium]|nr:ferrous iron transport protein B [Pirellulales bacterium]
MASASPPTPVASPASSIRVALVGNPNTGKSTLFNELAGMNARTGNYPGVTTEKKTGSCRVGDQTIELVDLPGTYSLAPRSPDELVAVDVLSGDIPSEGNIDLIVCVVNAALLQRNLFLVSQLLEFGKPVVIALNMSDIAAAKGISIDIAQLSARLGLRIVRTCASKRTGIDELKSVISEGLRYPGRVERQQILPDTFYQVCQRLSDALRAKIENQHPASSDKPASLPDAYLIERLLIDRGGPAEHRIVDRLGSQILPELTRAREELDAALGNPVDMECNARYAWAKENLQDILRISSDHKNQTSLTDRLDAVLTHRLGGLFFFVAVMFLIFQCIYSLAGYPMDWIDGVTELVSGTVSGWMSPGMLRSLIVDGVIAGVGGVLIFLPQIALLFLFLAVLEDCGYMSRAAFMVDRIMVTFGLSGKSFLPLMSSFACAVPGVMATRVIENRRDRIATIMVAPLMSCSARLPVYFLLIGAFIPATTYAGGWVSLQALVLMSMYCIGIVVAIPVAWTLKKTILRGETAPFVLELPEYKMPAARVVVARVWEASKAFVVRAGTLIFAASILIWFAGYWPGDHARQFELQGQIEAIEPEHATYAAVQTELQQESAALLENSLLGRAGHAIEPAVKPLGWDWKIGVGAVASFPAREVIIATLGTIYSLGGDAEEEGIIGAIRQSTWPDGSPVYTVPVALSIMVFFALCAQCVSTLLVIRRETNSWFWPTLSFTYMTVLAYLGALLTYQIGTRIL